MHNYVTLQQLVHPATTVFYKVNPFVLESNGRGNLKVTRIQTAAITLHFICDDFRRLWFFDLELCFVCGITSSQNS